jgi:hypothetical protein
VCEICPIAVSVGRVGSAWELKESAGALLAGLTVDVHAVVHLPFESRRNEPTHWKPAVE